LKITRYAKEGKFDPAEIAAHFQTAERVTFYARPANSLAYRPVTVHSTQGGESRTILLKCLLESLDIGPDDERLRVIFARHGVPDALESEDEYDELGFFHLEQREAFVKLAQLLGKPLTVRREYGDQGETPHLFDVHVNGSIIEAATP
jgi:hypothetical protein